MRGPRPAVQLGAVLVVGLVLRLWDLGGPSLWLDEVLLLVQSRDLSLGTIWFTPHDLHPPLYFTVQKLFLLLGDSEFVVRLSSVVFGVLSIGILYGLGRRLDGHECGIVAAALLATSSLHVEYSQEAHAYALHMFGVLLSSWGAVRFIRAYAPADRVTSLLRLRDTRRALTVYLVGAAIAVLAHNIAVFYVLAINVVLFGWWLRETRRDARVLVAGLAANGSLLVFWSVWLIPSLGGGLHPSALVWLPHYTAGEALDTMLGVYGQRYISRFQPLVNIAIITVAVFGLARSARQSTTFTLLLTVMIGAPVLTWLAGFVQPVFMTRTVMWELFAVFLAMGVAIRHVRHRGVKVALFVVLLMLNVKSTATYFQVTEREDWRRTAQLIHGELGEGDVPLVCANFMHVPFGYYLEDAETTRRTLGWDANGAVSRRASGRWDSLVERRMTLAEATITAADVWVIRSHCTAERGAGLLDDRLGGMGWPVVGEWRFTGIAVTRYRPAGESD